MKTQLEKNTTEISVKMAIDAWKSQNEKIDKFLAEISDDELKSEIAPGKNSGVYLVGHLAAVNDNLFQILGLGESLYPELLEIFLKNPDSEEAKNFSIDDLKKYWSEINNRFPKNSTNFRRKNGLKNTLRFPKKILPKNRIATV